MTRGSDGESAWASANRGARRAARGGGSQGTRHGIRSRTDTVSVRPSTSRAQADGRGTWVLTSPCVQRTPGVVETRHRSRPSCARIGAGRAKSAWRVETCGNVAPSMGPRVREWVPRGRGAGARGSGAPPGRGTPQIGRSTSRPRDATPRTAVGAAGSRRSWRRICFRRHSSWRCSVKGTFPSPGARFAAGFDGPFGSSSSERRGTMPPARSCGRICRIGPPRSARPGRNASRRSSPGYPSAGGT